MENIDKILPEFYREKELCTLFGVTRPTLARWQAKGDFPCPITIGPRTKILPKPAILAWLIEQRGADLATSLQPAGGRRRS